LPKRVRRVSEVRAALLDKGMVEEPGHHHMFRMDVAGVTTVITRISHGAREIDDYLAGLMSKQCYLRLGEFWELVECPLTREGWLNLISNRSQGGRNPFIGR
jgi:hypothetical protein